MDCPMCPDRDGADVVAELASGRVHLKSDADYRGYCVLVFRRHAVELYELTAEERGRWVEDQARIGKAIAEVCQPVKLNLSMLGNMVPHLHCHFMPRYETDPEWKGPPSFMEGAHRVLSPEEYQSLKEAIVRAIGA